MRSCPLASLPSALVFILSLLAASAPSEARAHGASAVPHRAAALEVRGDLGPPPAGVAALKFGEFFRMPVGPKGLEATERLLALDGRRVRLVGYMVREESPAPGRLILTPLPLNLGDEDESLADDLPPATVFVHLQDARGRKAPYLGGLLKLTGVLEIGTQDEGDGRVSTVRLILDRKASHQVFAARPVRQLASR